MPALVQKQPGVACDSWIIFVVPESLLSLTFQSCFNSGRQTSCYNVMFDEVLTVLSQSNFRPVARLALDWLSQESSPWGRVRTRGMSGTLHRFFAKSLCSLMKLEYGSIKYFGEKVESFFRRGEYSIKNVASQEEAYNFLVPLLAEFLRIFPGRAVSSIILVDSIVLQFFLFLK